LGRKLISPLHLSTGVELYATRRLVVIQTWSRALRPRLGTTDMPGLVSSRAKLQPLPFL